MRRPGRDRRARALPPAPPGPRPPGEPPRAVVVGGGIAGLAAGVALAERGVETVLLERECYLGGRVGGWPTTLRDGTPVTMSRGFHAFFRQYYNLRALLRRADPGLGMLVPLPDYPLLHRDGRADGFRGLPLTPPWNAAVLAARSPSFPVAELRRVNVVAALHLLDVDVPGVYERLDHVDAVELLERIRFPATARHLAFEVFSRSFFADPRLLSAAELASMFHLYFLGSSEGLLFDVPRVPFPQALWNPVGAYLRGLGAQVRTGATVSGIGPGRRRRFAVRTSDGVEEADAVVLATDVGGLREIVAASPQLGDVEWRKRIADRPSAPPFLVSRLWLDRPVRAERPAFLGTGGYPTLDNVSVLERYEDEARSWAARTGGSVVELHAYALAEGCDEREERARLLAQLHEVYPETADAEVVDERHELRADCPLFPPGDFPDRPRITTPDPHLVLAGDHVRVDLPMALMERAATSGVLAANTLLRGWGRPGHVVWSVPNQGRNRLLRAVARMLR
ncbi:FAD-dependent oxidoreductase [Marinactinospora thermotolerans]|uniref:Isorenieratene synthase n=1 Tax=Marinactinospora thermotolerans DSM 45154 TaxID=1122192 RepID=A0A1T4K403_9ACTN|nr:FAD-dependent oxidoreductase [Marinactinospora thermotolerans]SJZ37073.1 isorenieratene synthase [Marinactinospora thermotolerans DSM 45154]